MALLKFASTSLIEAKIARPGRGLLKDAHRHAFNYEPREGYLYVRSRAISSRTNDNFDTFPADEIRQAWATFIGKPVFVNHNNDDIRRKRGVIIDAALHEDIAPDGTKDTWVEVLMEVDAVRFPRLAEAIIKGDIERTSMGCDVAESECSVCANVARTPSDYCAHVSRMKGQRIRRRSASTGGAEDVLVHEVCRGLSFFENSLLVEPPADPTALFLGVDTRGVTGMVKAASKTAASAAEAQAIVSKFPASLRARVERLAQFAVYGPGYNRNITENLVTAMRFIEAEGDTMEYFLRKAEAQAHFAETGEWFQAIHPSSPGEQQRMFEAHKTAANEYGPTSPGRDAGTRWEDVLSDGTAATAEQAKAAAEAAHMADTGGQIGMFSYLQRQAKAAAKYVNKDEAAADYAAESAEAWGELFGGMLAMPEIDMRLPGMRKSRPFSISRSPGGWYASSFPKGVGVWVPESGPALMLVQSSGMMWGEKVQRLGIPVELPAAALSRIRSVSHLAHTGVAGLDSFVKRNTKRGSMSYQQRTAGVEKPPAGWSVEMLGLINAVRFSDGTKTLLWADGSWTIEQSGVIMPARGIPSAKDQKSARTVGTAWLKEVLTSEGRKTAGDDKPLSKDERSAIDSIFTQIWGDEFVDMSEASQQQLDGIWEKAVAQYRRGAAKVAFGETTVPPKIDTLRLAECPVCNEEADWDGTGRCRVCGYIPPPEPFRDPDLEVAKRVDMTDGWINPDLAKAPPFEKPTP